MDTTEWREPWEIEWEQEENARAAEMLAADIQSLMSNESGRRIAWWLLGEAGVFRSTYHDHAQAMAFAEGKRAFGLLFLEQLMAIAHKEYSLMQQEARNGRLDREHRRQLAARRADHGG